MPVQGFIKTLIKKGDYIFPRTKTKAVINDDGDTVDEVLEDIQASIPTKTSDLTNDSSFQNATQVGSSIAAHNSNNSAHSDIRAAIPTNTSDLVNDSGFVTSNDITGAVATHNASISSHSDIRNEIDDVREIAIGKTANYVCSSVTNTILDSTADIITLTDSLVDVDGNTITIDSLKKGDNVYVSELTVYDRWYAGNSKLYRLETAKVPVTDVKKNNVSLVQNNIAVIPNNVSAFVNDAEYLTIDTLPIYEGGVE